VLVQFGFCAFQDEEAEVLSTLNNFLIEQYANNRKVLLIVDEAQNLSNRVLEEIRLLSRVETTKEKVLRIILAGQPELSEKLMSPELVQLAQRIRLRFTSHRCRKRIAARMSSTASSVRLTRPADLQRRLLPVIYRYTGGIPRLVNTCANTAMMAAFAQDRDHVTETDVETAVQELQWVEFAARTNRLLTPTVERVVSAIQPHRWHAFWSGPRGRQCSSACCARAASSLAAPSTTTCRSTASSSAVHHCQIVTTPESCVIEDLNSTNGIYVKGKRVRKHNLNDGDVVQIGQHEIMYIDERAPKQQRSAEPSELRTTASEPAWGE